MATQAARDSFGKASRIRKAKEYQSISKKGRRLSLPHFVISYSFGAAKLSRLGMVVSRKVGGAVVRNRIKRILREFFRCEQRILAGPVDLVIHARPGCAAIPTVEIYHELRQGLLRASLLRETL